MENKLNKAKETVAQRLDFPKDIVLDIPKITIIGKNEITIENHKGIILFEEKQVKINSNIGLILIVGKNFEILFIGGDTITINGEFISIVYEQYEKS